MELPGTQYQAADSADLLQFLDEVCGKCLHEDNCTILVHAGAYGGAVEWRDVEGHLACTRQELPGEPAPPIQRDDSVGVTCLSLAGITVDEAIVATWTEDQFWEAIDWSSAVILEASDNIIEVPPLPAFLVPYQEVAHVDA